MMPALYKCPNCGKTYDAKPQDDICGDCDTVLAKVEPSQWRPPKRETSSSKEKASTERMEGLCVLVCDASYSMADAAFPQERVDLTKVQLVVDAVQNAIDAMANLTMVKNAYIAIIAFGANVHLITDLQGAPFIKSVDNIISEFTGQGKLAAYLAKRFELESMTIDREGTNITAALQLARDIVDRAIAGDLTEFGFRGDVSLLKHFILTRDGHDVDVPNVRVMLYSDGVHNRGELKNPFENMRPLSVLMTSFIGQLEKSADLVKAADDLKAIANICPKHGHPGYFLVHKEARGELLRKVFRMATKHSGFCTQCALEETSER